MDGKEEFIEYYKNTLNDFRKRLADGAPIGSFDIPTHAEFNDSITQINETVDNSYTVSTNNDMASERLYQSTDNIPFSINDVKFARMKKVEDPYVVDLDPSPDENITTLRGSKLSKDADYFIRLALFLKCEDRKFHFYKRDEFLDIINSTTVTKEVQLYRYSKNNNDLICVIDNGFSGKYNLYDYDEFSINLKYYDTRYFVVSNNIGNRFARKYTGLVMPDFNHGEPK